MTRKLIPVLLLAAVLFSSCSIVPQQNPKKYQASFLTLFDTVTVIQGLDISQEAFQEKAQKIHDELEVYHQLFDIYHDYDGVNNLKTVNDQAGIAPVTVDRKIVDLLLDCRSYYELTDGLINVAMGSVLQLWHEARSDSIDNPMNAYLPDPGELSQAAAHTAIDALVIDEENSTVFLSDPHCRLDVGAVAKGWSVQRVAETAPEGLLISVGGNVCATGPKDASGTPWVVGVNNPDGSEEYLHTLNVTNGSVVTSGDYQRYYVVDDRIYHHIIDPATLFPSTLWRSVTIVCHDSGLADALSTALFLLPQEAGQQLLDRCSAEAFWVDANGNRFYSPGFEKLIRT